MHVPTLVADGETAEIGPQRLKPTALTPGMHEADLDVWVDGHASAGFWECEVGSFTASRIGYTEVCQILSGSATIETEPGDSFEIRQGSTIIMPSGWRGTWHVHTPVRKLFVIVPDRELDAISRT